jgi:putative aldouronate transport system permease protein
VAAIFYGANCIQRLWGITLPSILPTIIILLILSIGRLFSVGYEKILLLYNPTIYETADVISTFVYRKGLIDFGWSYATAVGLFNSVTNLVLLVVANYLSRRVSETSLW